MRAKSVPTDSYKRGFRRGLKDLDPSPPADKGEAWEYLNGFLDATKDRGIGEYGVIDQERAEIARRSKHRRGADQGGQGQGEEEAAGEH